MGRHKLKRKDAPYRSAERIRIGNEALIAMQEFKARATARRALAENEEIVNKIKRADAHREIWMWGLFALVLHRRYRYTAKTINSILADVQDLHNELYDNGLEEEDLERAVCALVKYEVGLDMFDDDWGTRDE